MSWEIRQGDCRELLAGVEAESVSLVVADPPYNVGFGYASYVDALDPYEYLVWQLDVAREAERILRPGGSFWWLNYPEAAARMWCAVEEDIPGLHGHEWVTWIYHPHTGGVPLRKGTRAWLWFAKGEPWVDDTFLRGEYQNPDDRRIAEKIERGLAPIDYDWWECEQVKNVSPEKTAHPCQIPEALLRRIVGACCPEGGLVLDPFAGSGSTGVACVNLGRDFLGFELDPGYCDLARRRLAGAQEPLLTV